MSNVNTILTKAYKRAVLNHHPDKSKNKADKASKDNNEYFNCITRAFEQLSDPVKKMSYDSCDPEFDESVPGVTDKNKKNFFEVFGAAFENNSRFANRKPLPPFGDINSTFEDINNFYGFWYEFDSWREFSYQDEENKETATDRDERRWIDKENKANRLKLKKAEVRILNLKSEWGPIVEWATVRYIFLIVFFGFQIFWFSNKNGFQTKF